jgi:hypothetical protein
MKARCPAQDSESPLQVLRWSSALQLLLLLSLAVRPSATQAHPLARINGWWLFQPLRRRRRRPRCRRAEPAPGPMWSARTRDLNATGMRSPPCVIVRPHGVRLADCARARRLKSGRKQPPQRPKASNQHRPRGRPNQPNQPNPHRPGRPPRVRPATPPTRPGRTPCWRNLMQSARTTDCEH